MAGRTTLLIAHRRSTLNLADRIAVLTADGRLADIGTDAELTERCALYRLLLSGPGEDAEGVDAGEPARLTASTPADTASDQPRRIRRRRRRRSAQWQGEGQGPFDSRAFRAGGGASARCAPRPSARRPGRRGRRSRRAAAGAARAAPWTA